MTPIPNSKFISTIFEGARAPSWTLSGDYLGLLMPQKLLDITTGRFW